MSERLNPSPAPVRSFCLLRATRIIMCVYTYAAFGFHSDDADDAKILLLFRHYTYLFIGCKLALDTLPIYISAWKREMEPLRLHHNVCHLLITDTRRVRYNSFRLWWALFPSQSTRASLFNGAEGTRSAAGGISRGLGRRRQPGPVPVLHY